MFKNGHLRLLMVLVGFQRIGDVDDPEGSWIIPSPLSADQLKQPIDLIKKFEFSPPVFDDGQEATDFIRRKSTGRLAKKRAAFDDEDDEIGNEDEEEFMFPAGGPTAMKKSDALAALKKSRRRRRKDGSEDAEDGGLSDEQLAIRAKARRLRELEKNRKIKSELLAQESDDEEADRIFFAKEAERYKSKIAIMKELLHVEKGKGNDGQVKNRKRHSSAISGDSSDENDVLLTTNKKRRSKVLSVGSDEDTAHNSSPSAGDNVLVGSDDQETDTPMSSPHVRSQTKKQKVMGNERATSPEDLVPEEGTNQVIADDDEDDEDDVPLSRPRQRVRAGFIVDSSDEDL